MWQCVPKKPKRRLQKIYKIRIKKIKKMKNLIIAFVLLVTIVGCYKESNWLDENATGTGKFFPNVFLNPLDSTKYSNGGSVRCNIEFWSKDKIKEIRIYDSVGTASRKIVATLPATPAFSALKATDTLLYNYKVPTGLATNSSVRLDVVIENENGLIKLSDRRSFTIK